jgi:hypothetical protein
MQKRSEGYAFLLINAKAALPVLPLKSLATSCTAGFMWAL